MPPADLHRRTYNGLIVPAARLALPIAARVSPRLRRGRDARRGLLGRWQAAARRVGEVRPRVWFHAASAGETLQARPLVEAVREAQPRGALFYSFFSPSAERMAAGWTVPDASDYLPFDLPRRTGALVELLDPGALVLVGAELWPNLVWAAGDRGVPLAQACCRLTGSGRLAWPVRSWTRALYARFRAIAAVAEEDADLLRALGVPPEAVAVTGDTRVDATLARVAGETPPLPWRPPPGAGPVVVAGSTWPADEDVVLPAVARLRRTQPDLIAVVVPHEPSEAALARLEEAAAGLGLVAARLGELAARPEPEVVLVDRVGLLYRLYAGAAAAYVGGGFSGSVHNTMEPAAHGVPVAIGPRPGKAVELDVLGRRGAVAVIRSEEELASTWGRWVTDPAARASAGAEGRSALEGLAGATARTLEFFRDRGVPL